MRAGAVVVFALVAASVGGCSAEAEHPRSAPTPANASSEHLAAIADGEISEEEYTAGYKRFVGCLLEEGYEVVELGRPSTVYQAEIPDAAVQSGADEECYDRHFSLIDLQWQLENPPWTEVGERLKKCLADAGLPTDGDENILKERMQENGLDVTACSLGTG